MSLPPSVNRVLGSVERETGQRVEVMADPSLVMPARVQMARGGVPVHLVTYNPKHATAPFYVAFEATFILRLYALKPEERFLFAESGTGLRALADAASKPPLNQLPEPVRGKFIERLHSGLLIQLRSQSIGLRIHETIFQDAVELRPAQEQSIAAEQRDALQGLAATTRSVVPPQVFAANMAMNAALASFADRMIGRSVYAVPYESAGLLDSGSPLLAAPRRGSSSTTQA